MSLINIDYELLNIELAFSEKKIQHSFSNTSAWNYRLFWLKKLKKIQQLDLKKEFKLIHNAIFTDPMDSSAWLYFKWIILYLTSPLIPNLICYKTNDQLTLLMCFTEPISGVFVFYSCRI